MNNWHKKFIELSELVSTWSKDTSTKVGTVIVDEESKDVISIGYNGIPRNCDDNVEERHERPLKYKWFEHSERNAIYNAARLGKSTNNKTMYVQKFPCPSCARAIIQSGIKKIVSPTPDYSHHKYGDDFKISMQMLKEAEIKLLFYGES